MERSTKRKFGSKSKWTMEHCFKIFFELDQGVQEASIYGRTTKIFDKTTNLKLFPIAKYTYLLKKHKPV